MATVVRGSSSSMSKGAYERCFGGAIDVLAEVIGGGCVIVDEGCEGVDLAACRCWGGRCQLVDGAGDGRHTVDGVDRGRWKESGLNLFNGRCVGWIVEMGEENVGNFLVRVVSILESMIIHKISDGFGICEEVVESGVGWYVSYSYGVGHQ